MAHSVLFRYSILDPLHGLIRLTQDELAIIDQPIFRRLRNTKQNGLLWLVFPSATHTRFEHSLGALFVADAMWQALLSNSQVSVTKTPPRVRSLTEARAGQAVDLSSLDADVKDKLYRVIRLAALCHDLGHGPLSHTFDHFAPSFGDLKRLMTDVRLGPLADFVEAFGGYDNKGQITEATQIKHEVMSCVFFCLCWSKIRGGEEADIVRAVAATILGPGFADFVMDHRIRPWLRLAHDIVASAPADADRMDYLERDSKSFGVTYGLFDRNRLLKSFLCYNDATGALYRLGIKRSGLRAVENLVQARFELFVQVYYHKTNRAIELMLKEIARLAGDAGVNVLPSGTLDDLVASYVDLDDHEFFRRLRKSSSLEVRLLAEQIHDRRLWKRVHDMPPEITNERVDVERTTALANDVVMRLKERIPQANLTVDPTEPKATKDLERGAALLDRDEDGVYAARSSDTWPQASAIIRTLEREEKAIIRIYSRDSDTSLLRKIRVELRTVLGTPSE